MTYDKETDSYTLHSGRTFYAGAHGVLGLSPKPGDGVYCGWDGTLGESVPVITLAERHEITAEMIGRWIEWGYKES